MLAGPDDKLTSHETKNTPNLKITVDLSADAPPYKHTQDNKHPIFSNVVVLFLDVPQARLRYLKANS